MGPTPSRKTLAVIQAIAWCCYLVLGVVPFSLRVPAWMEPPAHPEGSHYRRKKSPGAGPQGTRQDLEAAAVNFTGYLLPLGYCKIQTACAIPSSPLPSVGLLLLAKRRSDSSHCKNECGFLPGFKPRHPTAHTQSSEQESVVLHVWVCLPSLRYRPKVGLQSAAQTALSWVKLKGKATWKHPALQCPSQSLLQRTK